MLRRFAPKLLQKFLTMATACWWFFSFLAGSFYPGVEFFLAVCHNTNALPEGQVTSDADTRREVEYLLTLCGPFGSGPVFAKRAVALAGIGFE